MSMSFVRGASPALGLGFVSVRVVATRPSSTLPGELLPQPIPKRLISNSYLFHI